VNLVDSSVWIDYFAARDTRQVSILSNLITSDVIVLGDLILVEVLQGMRAGPQLRLAQAIFSPLQRKALCSPDLAPIAADNYRLLRQRGFTVRGTIDVIIATWCIENKIALLHSDRDFEVFESELGLVCTK